MIPVTVEVEFEGDLKDMLKKMQSIQPFRLVNTSEHADALAYGTGPLKDMDKKVHNGAYSKEQINRDLTQWATKKAGKLGLTSPKAIKAFADNLTEKFWEEGMSPHDYWQQHIQWLEANVQKLFDEGYSFEDMLAEVQRRCINTLTTNDWIYNREVYNGFRIEPMNEAETTKSLKDEEERVKLVDDLLNANW